MVKQIPLAERVSGQAAGDQLAGLSILSQRLPCYFQGVAALTGLRRHRENLEVWQDWEERYYEDNFGPDKPGAPVRQEQSFSFWLRWAVLDLIDGDADMLINLILEPMYSIAESRCAKKGDL